MSRVVNILLGLSFLSLIVFSHLDRVAFLRELNESRRLYVNNIDEIRKDVLIIKDDVNYIKSKI